MPLLVFILEVILFFSFKEEYGWSKVLAYYWSPTLFGVVFARLFIRPDRLVSSSGGSFVRWVFLLIPFLSTRALFLLSFIPGFQKRVVGSASFNQFGGFQTFNMGGMGGFQRPNPFDRHGPHEAPTERDVSPRASSDVIDVTPLKVEHTETRL